MSTACLKMNLVGACILIYSIIDSIIKFIMLIYFPFLQKKMSISYGYGAYSPTYCGTIVSMTQLQEKTVAG